MAYDTLTTLPAPYDYTCAKLSAEFNQFLKGASGGIHDRIGGRNFYGFGFDVFDLQSRLWWFEDTVAGAGRPAAVALKRSARRVLAA